MVPSQTMQTLNTKSMADTLQAETGETHEYVYISPKGSRFLSLTRSRWQTTSVGHSAAGLATTTCNSHDGRVH